MTNPSPPPQGKTFANEDQLQAAVVRHLNNTYCTRNHTPRCVILHIPNGGKRSQIRLNAMGQVSGAADLLAVCNGQTLFLELKQPGETQSPDQIQFQADITAAGATYRLAVGYDAAIAAFREWYEKII